MAKKYKLALVFGGFIQLYFEYLKTLCVNNQVELDVFEENDRNIDIENYDYLLCDNLRIEKCAKVFHNHSVLYQIGRSKFLIYRILYFLTHLNKIKSTEFFNKSYSKCICVSKELKRDLQKYYNVSADKIIVAHAGFVPPEQNNEDKLFKKYNIEEPFTICTSAVGFVTKGGYTLLGALRRFRKMYPNVKIKANIIYPKYKTNLAVKLYVKLFKLDDMVEFFGYQDNINEFYNKAHCLTCQSVHEAFGRIVTEAMYQKIPVIVGSNIGASDIIKDGINGFVFEDGKNASKNLANKIKEVYDKYEQLEPIVENAYHTSETLTWENFAKEIFYGLYPELKKINNVLPLE